MASSPASFSRGLTLKLLPCAAAQAWHSASVTSRRLRSRHVPLTCDAVDICISAPSHGGLGGKTYGGGDDGGDSGGGLGGEGRHGRRATRRADTGRSLGTSGRAGPVCAPSRDGSLGGVRRGLQTTTAPPGTPDRPTITWHAGAKSSGGTEPPALESKGDDGVEQLLGPLALGLRLHGALRVYRDRAGNRSRCRPATRQTPRCWGRPSTWAPSAAARARAAGARATAGARAESAAESAARSAPQRTRSLAIGQHLPD